MDHVGWYNTVYNFIHLSGVIHLNTQFLSCGHNYKWYNNDIDTFHTNQINYLSLKDWEYENYQLNYNITNTCFKSYYKNEKYQWCDQ